MNEVFIGVDLGTTRTKVGLVDSSGVPSDIDASPTRWSHTEDGPVLDIETHGEMVERLIVGRAHVARDKGQHIAGIGITGMGETGALLDADGRAKAPGFAWHHPLGDPRRVQADLGEERFQATTGHGLDLAPSLIKLDYLRTSGTTFAPGDKWLNLPDYIAWRLTGVHATEYSLAGRTGLFDLRAKTWWQDALTYLDLPSGFLPEHPVTGHSPVGRVQGHEGIEGVPVVIAGHDHPVAAISGGLDRPGPLALSLGTSEAHVRIIPPTLSEKEVLHLVGLGCTIDWHPGGEYWYVLSTLPTGLTLERLARVMGAGSREARMTLSEQARSIDLDPKVGLARVSLDSFDIIGVNEATTPVTLWRRAVEDLLQNSDRHIRDVSRILGDPAEVYMFGGWSLDPLIREQRMRRKQVMRDGMSIEPGLLGAAMSAARGAGMELPYSS